MRVWVIGHKGMLGRAVGQRLDALDRPWVGSDLEVSISDRDALATFARAAKPTHVINCAAFTHVDGCETQLEAATAANDVGPGLVGEIATRNDMVALHISTDYVFDGRGHRPYREDDPTVPLGAYGRTKLTGEHRFSSAMQGRGYMVRTSWLFGEGRNFVRTMLTLMAQREEIGVVADQRGCPTYTEDLAAALLDLLGLGAPRSAAAPGVYHFCNSGETSWHAFATAIAARAPQHGAHVACKVVRPLTTAQYPTPTQRPAYSVLDTSKVSAALGYRPRPWQECLDAYLSTQPWLRG